MICDPFLASVGALTIIILGGALLVFLIGAWWTERCPEGGDHHWMLSGTNFWGGPYTCTKCGSTRGPR